MRLFLGTTLSITWTPWRTSEVEVLIWTCSSSEKVFLDQDRRNVTIKHEIVAEPNHDQATLIIEMNHSHPWDIEEDS